MKNILKITLLLSLIFSTVACSSDDNTDYNDASLDVNYLNVSGTWALTEWNGEAIDNIYCYLVLDRKEKTFVMYQNMDSMTPRKLTGTFTLSKDKNDETIDLISGVYDFGNGKWNNDYIIQVYKDKMIWTVSNDPSDVSVYTRYELPAHAN